MAKGKDIAKAINKTPSAISYLKKTNPEEYEILELGYLCKKFGIDENLLVIFNKILLKMQEDLKSETSDE